MENKKKFEEPKAEFVQIDDSIKTQVSTNTSGDVTQFSQNNNI